MFKEHSNTIWGTKCSCHNDVYALQNKFHPWEDTDFTAIIPCPKCGSMAEIDVTKAREYYNQRILSNFSDIQGTVLDLGCGGGFLTQYANSHPNIKTVIALDNDPDCQKDIAAIDANIDFHHADASTLEEFPPNSLDYLISRDVFMFIEDTPAFFQAVNKVVRQGIRQMGWYKSKNPRMKNTLHPEEIARALSDTGWRVELSYLDWYPSGYFLKADR